VIRDFFETEYRENVQPATYFEFAKSWSNWSLNALAQPRVNDFFDTVERLPDLKLTGLRQQLWDLPLFYDSDSSIGYFRRRFADSGTNGFGAFRGDTYHQVTLPHTFFNWLTITPRVGGRATYYGEEDGYGSRRDEQDRYVFNTGAELTTKASRVWQGAESRFFEIDGLRHILQPSINYVYVPRPSRPPRELPQFDYELPSRRLLPIEYPDYNRIDSVDSQNVLRLGLRNKLQTKRSGVVEDFATWALYTDWRLRPLANQATFADIYSDAEFAPFHWLSLSSELRYNVEGEYWKEANHYLTLLPGPDWSLSVGHRYLRDDPFYGVDSGHNLISTRFYYRFNENWGFRATHHFEARDGTMEEQIYTMYRDFRSWTGALSFRIRESRGGEPRDYTIGVIFNLKAFPRFKLKDDVDKPSMLFGG
jgi:LPS-assembly protein